MTLTKQTLSEALAVWDRTWDDGARAMPKSIGQAARFVERLLPGECEEPLCDGGHVDIEGNPPHMDCHGTGQLWDEGLVEVVAKVLWPGTPRPRDYAEARAVLAALAEEVGK